MLRRIWLAWLALKELGFSQVFLNGLYRLGMISGYFRWRTPVRKKSPSIRNLQFLPVFTIPSQQKLVSLVRRWQEALLKEADDIVLGQFRLFGGEARPLNLAPRDTAHHWTIRSTKSGDDIKLIWEPARFGWVFSLGRAYQWTSEERYPQTFWKHWEQFTAANPINCGPNWESGQEVALRLIAYIFAHQVFDHSPASTSERKAALKEAIADHAQRIPPTLIYARSQHNNHLISEACGLYLAGTALPNHPRAKYWRKTGWHWLQHALRTQIDIDGTHAQHSMNYHRMVIHLALLGQMAAHWNGQDYSADVKLRLKAATRWMLAQIDARSGGAPNLGNNDGANILPFGHVVFRDHRATAQSAAAAFLGERFMEPGGWDELSAWLGIPIPLQESMVKPVDSQAVRRLGDLREWATLRAVRYHSRPAHADQLQVELWFDGQNILIDPGTMAYNQPPIWNNSLVFSWFHNTITVDGEDPMLKAGKFLWLKWDQAGWIEAECVPGQQIAAEHFGYLQSGIAHKRILRREGPGDWLVQDFITPVKTLGEHKITLQWLVPDGTLLFQSPTLFLNNESLSLTLEVNARGETQSIPGEYRIVRGGKLVYGTGEVWPNEGWYSPTYMAATPVNSIRAGFKVRKPLVITTRITVKSLVNPHL